MSGALLAAAMLLSWIPDVRGQEPPAPTRSDLAPPKGWEATAPGRVEPSSQEIRMTAASPARIAEVLVAANDTVFPGELLIRLDDSEALARLAGAEAQVALRERLRNDEKKKGPAERRRAEDAVGNAEKTVADARFRLDQAAAAVRRAHRTPGADAAVNAARSALARTEHNLGQEQDALRSIKEFTGLPTSTESALSAARADLTLARAGLEHTRIRAPIAGTVLDVDARPGELAAATPEHPLILLADLSALRVRAELDERDVGKVRIGQAVLVRANAFKDRTFSGTVRSVAQFVGPPRIGSRGPRSKLADVDVLQVMVDLEDSKPLAVGMQVDVYFRSEPSEHTGSR